MMTKLKWITGLWLVSMLAGVAFLNSYSASPGERIDSNVFQWPKQSQIMRSSQNPNLVLFAHPHCPCSQASIAELERLMPYLIGKVDVNVVFVQPQGRDKNWVEGELWEKTKYIPGVSLSVDPDYREADLFQAKTSGQVFLFDRSGWAVFRGGITPARGHEGESRGKKFILSWINIQNSQRLIANVYGCALKQEGNFNVSSSY